MKEVPVTFREPAYALWSTKAQAVMTTEHGNLAIFSTKSMAELYAKQGGFTVIPVTILNIEELPGAQC